MLIAASACIGSYGATPQPLRAGFGLAENQNFCPDGVFGPASANKPLGLQTWGSYCNGGNENTGRAVTSPFPAPRQLSLYLDGSPSFPGLSIELEHMDDGSHLSLKPHADASTIWRRYNFIVPDAWVGSSVRLIAEDRAAGWGGWVAFSEPVQPQSVWQLGQTGVLLWKMVWHFVLIMVPCFALCAFAAWRGVTDPLVLGGLALVEIGCSAYLAFWAWFLSGQLGHQISVIVAITGAVALMWFVAKLNAPARSAVKSLAAPALLTFCASAMVLAAGFLYGGMDLPLATQSTRFTHQLMADNRAAFVFATQVRAGRIQKPITGDWHSSDRPPLQTGMVLAQWPFLGRSKELAYSIISAIAQSLWIFALWLLLTAFRANRRAVSLALFIPLFTGFVFINTFYVWPKLFAAAFMIASCAFLLPPGSADQLGKKPFIGAIPGALLAFGLLTHGASFFAALGMAVIALILRIKVRVRALALLLVTCVLLYVPWTLYQKLFDPPGDRLLKWHLAGVYTVDRRPFLEALRDSYAHLSFSQLVRNRESSGERIFDHLQEYWGGIGHLVPALLSGSAGRARVVELLAEERVVLFFYLVPVLGFLIVGPVALAAGISQRYRSVEWHAGFRLWLYVFWVLVVSWILMFPPEAGVIFVQPYVTALLAFAGSTLALWAVAEWLAFTAGALQVALNFLAYGIYMREPGTPGVLTEGVLQYGNLALFLAAAVTAILLLASISRAHGAFGADARFECVAESC